MKQVKAVEGKVRVARERFNFGFADSNGDEMRVSNLRLEQRKVSREQAVNIDVASDGGFG